MIALVQRPRRKKHLAHTAAGSTTWDTIGSCRLTIPIEGTTFTAIDASAPIGTSGEQDDDVCLHCLHLIAFASFLSQTSISGSLTAVAS